MILIYVHKLTYDKIGSKMSQLVKRGFVESDEVEFKENGWEKVKRAADDIKYLLNHGYQVKNSITFVGNHYMLSERQRLALTRGVSSDKDIMDRKKKLVTVSSLEGKTVYIDGFNTIITLEVALSHALLIQAQDSTIRDLAGLRGTYRIIDKTEMALRYIMKALDKFQVKKAVIYLDAPVSNSGRLKELIIMIQSDYFVEISVQVIHDVDRVLEKREYVVTSDAIILNKCISWINLNGYLLEYEIEKVFCCVL